MSSLPADLVIWALLSLGTIFFGVGLMGLVLFPDTKSRMFTAFRATSIGLGAGVLAVITYAYTRSLPPGSDQYLALIVRALLLGLVLAAGTWMMYGSIRERIGGGPPERSRRHPAGPETGKKNGE